MEKIYNNLHLNYNFDIREEQLKMSEIIKKGIYNEIPVLLEAETGSGKTMAYLIPLIKYSLDNSTNVVISTNTLNLQDQILKKELPILQEIFEGKINYTLIKGRNNYICKRKFNESTNVFIKEELEKISKYFSDDFSGDKSDIKEKISDEFWENIKSEQETTLYKKCPYFKECFFYKARDKQKEANIFVVNHHILLLDILMREQGYKIIPDYTAVVIDEAHNLENIIRKYFSYNFSFLETYKYIGQVYNNNIKSIDKSSLLIRFLNVLRKNVDEFKFDEIVSIFKDNIDIIYYELENIKKKIINKIPNSKANGVIADKLSEIKIDSNLEKIIDAKNILNKYMLDIENFLKENEEIDEEAIFVLLSNYMKKIFLNLESLFIFFEFNFDKYIHYLKYEDKLSLYPEIIATPYDISNDFYDKFISKIQSLVFVSATLTINKSFEYIKNNIGIKNSYNDIVKSSFDYKNQMKIRIISDLPNYDEENFKEKASKFILEYVLKRNGKTLVLFTSYSDLNYVYNYLVNKNTKLNILKQGEYSRVELINKFKNMDNSVLLGTDSFWEGVDIQGEALSSVIIFKLPFQVPDDPVVESISKRMGSLSFKNYQLPYATLKVKQGIGRLIRSKEDKGEIIILDKRIYIKSYGKIILKSLFDTKISIEKMEEII